MELYFIILLVFVDQATYAGQCTRQQDLNNESGTGGSHTETSQFDSGRTFHEIVLFGQRIRTQLHPDNESFYAANLDVTQTIPLRLPSIANEAAPKMIHDIVDNDHNNEQHNVKRRRLSEDAVSLTSLDQSVAAIPDTSQFISTSGAGTSKILGHCSSPAITEPELDLNLKSTEENYIELCRLLGKEQNSAELSFLKRSTPNECPISFGRKTHPITIKLKSDQIYLTEWPQICYAKNTLVKLILVARFYQKVDPIWGCLTKQQKTVSLYSQYDRARSIMLCLTGCCGNDLIKFQTRRDNPFKHSKFRGLRCPDHKLSHNKNEILRMGTDLNITYLNMRTIDDNYRDLCRLLGKQEDLTELTELSKLIPKGGYNNGLNANPVTIHINGEVLSLTEWSQMRSAQSTMVKLILVVHFYQKLNPIWDEIGSEQKTSMLHDQYRWARAIMFCLQHCCANNLLEFYRRWNNPFNHRKFSQHCCSAILTPGSQCGFFKDKKPSGNNTL